MIINVGGVYLLVFKITVPLSLSIILIDMYLSFHRLFNRLVELPNLFFIDINFITLLKRKTLTTPADHSIQIVL